MAVRSRNWCNRLCNDQAVLLLRISKDEKVYR